ncbi:MAG TPA: hypothetical protein VEC09_01200 [Actinomycetota bacterium]|nr:hypothetical protein [Actinomycetota bacterium]
MRRGWAIGLAIVAVLVLVGVGVGGYHAGVDEGIRRAGDPGPAAEVVGRGYGHDGFFPFGWLLFPLIVFGLLWLTAGAFRRGPWGGDDGRHGPWSDEGRARFERTFDEWHQRQHAQGSTSSDPGGGAAA